MGKLEVVIPTEVRTLQDYCNRCHLTYVVLITNNNCY